MKNRILHALSAKEYRALASHLRPVELRQGTVLLEAGQTQNQIYFPESALISFLSGTAEGESIEVCSVGNEGAVGITQLLGNGAACRVLVQVPGTAMSAPLQVVRREFARCGALHDLALRYTHSLLVQIAQTAVCNKFHSIESRLCRWLLLAQDRVGSESFVLTQDAMARILGSRRASVTVVAGELRRQGLIWYNRGEITVGDRKRLQLAACECYEIIHALHSKFSA